jgi:proliferating cell nuclear antigen
MNLTTIQASAIKSCFEVLSGILNDVNIYFKPEGVFVTTLDTARTSLIDLRLSAENFEEYECKDPIVAGVNISNTFKLLKSITNNDILKLSIYSKEFMNIEIVSENKKTKTKFELKLLDINENIYEVPEIPMTVTTSISSVDFQRICRDMSNIGTDIRIRRVGNTMSLACSGDFANQETSIECIEKVEKELCGEYSLRYLNIFTKATSMCAMLQLMQEEGNRFLVLKYSIANLGELRFYLATKSTE